MPKTASKNKRGRPLMQKEERKTFTVSTGLNIDQYEKVLKKANEANLTIGAFIKKELRFVLKY